MPQAVDGHPDANAVPLTADQIPAQVDLLIALKLNLWPALTIAIQNGWGTSSPQISADKRDWLAGAVSDLFAQKQLRDVEDLEEVLEQVMSDEFEAVVDDGTLEEVARGIWKGRERILKGDGSEVTQLMASWEERKRKGGDKVVAVAQSGEEDVASTSGDEDGDEEEWEGFEDATGQPKDVDMDDAPTLIDVSNGKTKPEPEIDEDGFTKVVSKKRR